MYFVTCIQQRFVVIINFHYFILRIKKKVPEEKIIFQMIKIDD